MAQGYNAPVPQRLWTDDGDIAVGWKLTTYEPGTTTPLVTYSDTELSSENENPIVTDASGFFRCFVAAGIGIKFAVTDENDVPKSGYSIDGLLPMVDPEAPTPSDGAVLPGTIVAYGGTVAPTGYLMCDGSLYSRATFAGLFAIIGTNFGTGDGMTTAGLPDLRGRFPLGVAASGTGSTLGGTGGAIDHTHTGPSHTHSVVVTRDGWGATLNSPSTTGRLNVGEATGTGQFSSSYQPTADVTITSAAGGTGNTGTANSPFQAVNFIIKT